MWPISGGEFITLVIHLNCYCYHFRFVTYFQFEVLIAAVRCGTLLFLFIVDFKKSRWWNSYALYCRKYFRLLYVFTMPSLVFIVNFIL